MDAKRTRHHPEGQRWMHAYRAALICCQPDSSATIPRIPERNRNRKHGKRRKPHLPCIQALYSRSAYDKRSTCTTYTTHSLKQVMYVHMCNGLQSCCYDNLFRIGPFDPLNTGDGKSKRLKNITWHDIHPILPRAAVAGATKSCPKEQKSSNAPFRIHTCPPVDNSGHRNYSKRL